MAQNPLVEQAKQGNINAIASLMNRLLKSQGMLANVEREGDRLDVLIESDLRSLDDEVRTPKRQVLVGMIKKWFVTLDVSTISSIKISWQQTGSDEPAWTEEIHLLEQEELNVNENSGLEDLQGQPKIPPLPVFTPKAMRNDEHHPPSHDRPTAAAADLDEMFGEIVSPVALPNIPPLPERLSEPSEPKSLPDSDFLLLSDIPAIPHHQDNNQEISDLQPATPLELGKAFNNLSWQNLLITPNVAIQFVQYLVVCGIIILTLRGIHTAFGSSKAPKAAIITTQIITTQIVLS
jgi:hypothetical protein